MNAVFVRIILAVLLIQLVIPERDLYSELRAAAEVRDVDVLATLLSQETTPEWFAAQKDGGTRILEAAATGSFDGLWRPESKCVEVLSLLFEHGARLDPPNTTILYSPLADGDSRVVELLLRHGASATQFGEGVGTKRSPVELAVERGYEACREVLIRHGARAVDEWEALQLRFVHEAAWGGARVLEDLLREGASLDRPNKFGETALLRSISPWNGRREYSESCFFFLLDRGADVNKRGTAGRGSDETTALHHTISTIGRVLEGPRDGWDEQRADVAVRMLDGLLARGAHVSAVDSSGRTPLHIAAIRSNTYVVDLLIKHHAKVLARDNAGKTPLDHAVAGEVIRLLKEAGARERG